MKKLAAVFAYLCALACALSAAPAWSAAGITITPVYAQAFDVALNPIGKPGIVPTGGYIAIDFRMSLSGLASDEDFGVVTFNINSTPGLVPIDFDGYWMNPGAAWLSGAYSGWRFFPVPPPARQSFYEYDGNGVAVGGFLSHWQAGNADFGSDFNDLQDIFVGANRMEASNRQYGEAVRPAAGYPDQLGGPADGGTLLGTVIYQLNGPNQSVSVSPSVVLTWGTYQNNSTGTGTAVSYDASTFTGMTLLAPVPEPSTFALAALGAVALLALRHRF